MAENERQVVMRPLDVVILLKKITPSGRTMNGKQLADALGISPAEVSISLVRSRFSRLLDAGKNRVNALSLKEFLLHGMRYVFPASPGALVRGIPTASSAYPISKTIASTGEHYVWADPEGTLRGQSIVPLYPKAAEAAKKDPDFYSLLTIIDSLRIGQARERKAAESELEKYLESYARSN